MFAVRPDHLALFDLLSAQKFHTFCRWGDRVNPAAKSPGRSICPACQSRCQGGGVIGADQLNGHRLLLPDALIVQIYGSPWTLRHADAAAFAVVLVNPVAVRAAGDYSVGTIDQAGIALSAAAAGEAALGFNHFRQAEIDLFEIIPGIFQRLMLIFVLGVDRKMRETDLGRSHKRTWLQL